MLFWEGGKSVTTRLQRLPDPPGAVGICMASRYGFGWGAVGARWAPRPILEFAEECDRLAQKARTEDQRRSLMRMAAAWRKVADEYDREHCL
jgi:hypothetical protein